MYAKQETDWMRYANKGGGRIGFSLVALTTERNPENAFHFFQLWAAVIGFAIFSMGVNRLIDTCFYTLLPIMYHIRANGFCLLGTESSHLHPHHSQVPFADAMLYGLEGCA